MAEMTMEIKIDGVEDMRRLSAALEQYNAGSRGDAAQIEALRAELDKVRKQLHREQNETTWAAAYIVGDPVAPRVPGNPCSLIETVALTVRKQLTEARDELAAAYNIIKNRNMRLPGADYKTELLSAIAELVDRDVRREIGADLAGIKQQLFIANEEITKQAREIDSLRADLRKEQKIKDFVNDECQKIRAALGLGRMAQAPEVLAAIEDLRNDSRMIEGTASALRGRLQDSERDAEARAEVIKELHKQYHELEARKQATQYDLDRANDEIAAAEAEIAKYKPLIEAVRGGIAYCYWGKWVPINSVTVADMNDGTAVSLFIPNSEDPQCL